MQSTVKLAPRRPISWGGHNVVSRCGLGRALVQPQPMPCTETWLALSCAFPELKMCTAVSLVEKSAAAWVKAALPPLMNHSTIGRLKHAQRAQVQYCYG
eukprot:SAG31_NODE_356_length_17180_cov_7.595925_11_plen_99_part_00